MTEKAGSLQGEPAFLRLAACAQADWLCPQTLAARPPNESGVRASSRGLCASKIGLHSQPGALRASRLRRSVEPVLLAIGSAALAGKGIFLDGTPHRLGRKVLRLVREAVCARTRPDGFVRAAQNACCGACGVDCRLPGFAHGGGEWIFNGGTGSFWALHW
jgi:hypothetical protein